VIVTFGSGNETLALCFESDILIQKPPLPTPNIDFGIIVKFLVNFDLGLSFD
jgi:hypothetical protein